MNRFDLVLEEVGGGSGNCHPIVLRLRQLRPLQGSQLVKIEFGYIPCILERCE